MIVVSIGGRFVSGGEVISSLQLVKIMMTITINWNKGINIDLFIRLVISNNITQYNRKLANNSNKVYSDVNAKQKLLADLLASICL